MHLRARSSSNASCAYSMPRAPSSAIESRQRHVSSAAMVASCRPAASTSARLPRAQYSAGDHQAGNLEGLWWAGRLNSALEDEETCICKRQQKVSPESFQVVGWHQRVPGTNAAAMRRYNPGQQGVIPEIMQGGRKQTPRKPTMLGWRREAIKDASCRNRGVGRPF